MEWKGVFPALLTPFKANDEIDLQMFRHNLIIQLNAGIHGAVIGGSLGEASTITEIEKEKLVKTALELVGGKIPVILNIAEGSTNDALRQVKNAETWGADGLMLLPPMRYKSDDRETVIFFRSIAKSTRLPIMIYNNPVDYKIEVTPDMFEELKDCANINAVKESTRDLKNLGRLRDRFGDRFSILCGVDTIAMEELAMGADGWVAGLVCAFPFETTAIYNLVKAGKLDEARKINDWFMPLLELDIHTKLVQYIKLAASRVGLSNEWVRAPRLILEGEERERILRVIDEGIRRRPKS